MLQNAYFLAKIGADTAENEQHFAEILPIGRRVADRCRASQLCGLGRGALRVEPPVRRNTSRSRQLHSQEGRVSKISKIGKFCKILQIFGGLVLGCIEAKICKKICV